LLGGVVALANEGSLAAVARHAPLLFAFGCTIVAVCGLACIGPVVRALRVQPVEALREQL
jgi:hypothetical protein